MLHTPHTAIPPPQPNTRAHSPRAKSSSSYTLKCQAKSTHPKRGGILSYPHLISFAVSLFILLSFSPFFAPSFKKHRQAACPTPFPTTPRALASPKNAPTKHMGNYVVRSSNASESNFSRTVVHPPQASAVRFQAVACTIRPMIYLPETPNPLHPPTSFSFSFLFRHEACIDEKKT